MNAREAAPKDRPAATTAAAKQRTKSTATARQVPTWQADAQATLVTSRTGSRRWLLIYHCPACQSERHVSHARTLYDVVIRKTVCGRGAVSLSVGWSEAAA